MTVYPLGRQGVELLNFTPPLVQLIFFTFLFIALIFVPFAIALEFLVGRWHRLLKASQEGSVFPISG